jgi:glycosyltransferase involved in cell wall biosynthesis
VTLITTESPSGPPVEGIGRGENFGIIVFSHLRWGFVWQRPQQFLSRFAEWHPVLFVEEPIDDLGPGSGPEMRVHQVAENIHVAAPHVARGAGFGESYPEYVREAIQQLPNPGAFALPLFWFYSPMMAEWALDSMPHRGVVYDCMDELSQFHGAPRELVDNERRLMEHADIMFTGGYKLLEKKSQQHENVHCFGCGVEFDHFAKAQSFGEVPSELLTVKKPVVGWFGVIDERVDYELVRRAAEMRPDVSFVLVGPVVKVDPASLPQASNIHWFGSKDYKELPDYCRGFDVCMMCFAINEATEFINPTKALEYLATGRPVISTPVQDVVQQYQETVTIVESPEEFVTAIDRLVSSPDSEQIRKGVELARESSWEGTVGTMRQLISEAILQGAKSNV